MGHSLSLSRSRFHKDFLDLAKSLQNEKETQARKSLIMEFIPRWDLKESDIKSKLLNSTYPQDDLQPELFEKLIVFELYHMLHSDFVDDRRINNILLLIVKTLPKILKTQMKKYTIEEALYYFIMSNFISISMDCEAFPRIINLLEYFNERKSLRSNYFYFLEVKDSPILRHAVDSLEEIFRMLQFNYSDLDKSKVPDKNEFEQNAHLFDGLILEKHPEISSSNNRCSIIKIKSPSLNKALLTWTEAVLGKALLPLIPKKYLIFDYYIDQNFSLNLYCNTIALSKKLLDPNKDIQVAKAQCMITILYEVARLAKIKKTYDGKYFAVKLQDHSLENPIYILPDNDFFLETILYGGAVNLEILDSETANYILTPENYRSQNKLSELKDRMKPYIIQTNINGMNMGRPVFNAGMESHK